MSLRSSVNYSRVCSEKLPGEGLRVLVVDDEPDLCLILAKVLGSLAGYEVHTALDARSALLIVGQQERPFDGVFLDIQMPGMSGIDLCAVLRRITGYADVPILMLTAMTDREYLRKAFVAGANDLIFKPFDFDDLKARFAGERTNRFRRVGLKEFAAPDGKGAAGGSHEIIRSLEDPIAIPGVTRCIKKEAFEIYLRHSARRYNSSVWIRAIKIGRVYDLFTRLPEREFQRVMQGLALAYSNETEKGEDIFTYAGNGVFLSSSIGRSLIKTPRFLNALECKDGVSSVVMNDVRLTIFVSNQIMIDERSESDVMALINQSIESAECAENNYLGWGSYREWLSQKNSTGNEQAHNAKADYHFILKDFIRKGHLGWKR